MVWKFGDEPWAGSVRLGLLLVLIILQSLRSGSFAIGDGGGGFVLALPVSPTRAHAPGEACSRPWQLSGNSHPCGSHPDTWKVCSAKTHQLEKYTRHLPGVDALRTRGAGGHRPLPGKGCAPRVEAVFWKTRVWHSPVVNVGPIIKPPVCHLRITISCSDFML